MNKKLNTALFIIGATVGNILVFVLITVLWVVIIGYSFKPFLEGNGTLQSIFQVLVSLSWVVGLIGSYIVYNRVAKIMNEKIDMEKYFHPINLPFFNRKNSGPKQ
ncbi:MAG: hypothetical protein JW969_12885 [Spirochaetales bacterium]|nr:hypothetical protein [Spirochaetales bacterium]